MGKAASDDLIRFSEDSRSDDGPSRGRKDWVILIVDDEEDIHRVTKLVLSKFRFQRKGIAFLSAYSSAEAKEILARNPDISIALLDVVMEERDAGLKLVEHIRRVMGNKMLRIILRTGQPGEAPEGRVIIDYDINDYMAKIELTEQKLVTSIVAALRTYSDLASLERNRKGLEKIIEGSANVFEVQSLKKLTSGILAQLAGLLSLDNDAVYLRISGLAATDSGGEFTIVSATGKFAHGTDKSIDSVLAPEVCRKILEAAETRTSGYLDGGYIGYFRSSRGSQNIIYVEGWDELEDTERKLIEVFCSSASVAFDNIYLNKEIEESQKEIIFTLGDIVDTRSRETGNHVRRVGEYCRLLASKAGLTDDEANLISIASSIHDIGKLGIPDFILDKKEFLSSDEFERMKSHAEIGANMLKHSSRDLLRAAATIALQHHERYDGSGYPLGLKGESIHVFARITAIADVFDAISHDRVYRKAMGKDETARYFREESAGLFDPRLLDIFLADIDEFFGIQEEIPGIPVGARRRALYTPRIQGEIPAWAAEA